MRMVDLINRKKNGGVLSRDEIRFIVEGYTKGDIPDYQMSAFLMAVCFNGMSKEETYALTAAYVDSGKTIDLSGIEGIKVDKHSTGGVGDKISLVIIGLCAAAGIPVAKMSGRGLGHTGGTIDKLESIQGFRTELTTEEFISNVKKYKMAIAGQSPDLTPADKKIYSLRDVTATVDSIPLIAASIMSKKIASGADCIVLDVKVGSGAFMKTTDDAVRLAETMVEIGRSAGRKTIAVVTDMSQPLGHEIGNANEVREAIEILKGNGAEDETVIALTIASYMTYLGGAFKDVYTARESLKEIIKSGKALSKFKEFIRIQGGNPEVVDNPDILPKAANHVEVKAEESGYICGINAEDIGVSAMLLGAGRAVKDDRIDHSAGITLVRKSGEKVEKGDVLCVLHTNRKEWAEAEILAKRAYKFSDKKPEPIKYIHKIIE